ncbi:exosome complex component MTR3-like [Venturia canescens]|uniref:exosome complex component MTR3-like n=1 Tax=Venturia canescens TaxID=32260 RepID=UPI001C9C6243|nr:exosome complex component MTR3-like [Venturia canescens]
MPVDQKRINGPDVSIPYSIYVDLSKKQSKNQGDAVEREDGRAHDHLRKMFVKTGIVSQAKGSAYIEMGKTKVVCSVFDPRETSNKSGYSIQGSLYCEFKFATFSCVRRRVHQHDSEEKEYSLIMQRALEPAVCRHEFPNFQVDIYALVLDNDGSCLGAAIMAASLALANASIPMYGLVTAVTVGIHSDQLLLDPTSKEEKLCQSNESGKEQVNHGIMMQATLSQHNQIAELYFAGDIDKSLLKSAVEISSKSSEKWCTILQQCLVKSVVESLKENKEER